MRIRAQRKRVRRLTVADVDELVEDRKAGAQIASLAQRFGIGRTTVMEHLRRRGVQPQRWRGRTLTPDQLHEAGEQYRSGQNLAMIGDELDVDRRYLRRALRSADITIRRPGRQAST